jgi:hypothetical protein
MTATQAKRMSSGFVIPLGIVMPEESGIQIRATAKPKPTNNTIRNDTEKPETVANNKYPLLPTISSARLANATHVGLNQVKSKMAKATTQNTGVIEPVLYANQDSNSKPAKAANIFQKDFCDSDCIIYV